MVVKGPSSAYSLARAEMSMSSACPSYGGFMPRRALLGALLLVTGIGCSAASTSGGGSTVPPSPAHAGGSTAGAATAKPCGTAKHATYRHVIWIFLENRTYSSVLGRNGEATNLKAFA